MFNYNGAIPIGSNVALLAVFTFKGFVYHINFAQNFTKYSL